MAIKRASEFEMFLIRNINMSKRSLKRLGKAPLSDSANFVQYCKAIGRQEAMLDVFHAYKREKKNEKKKTPLHKR